MRREATGELGRVSCAEPFLICRVVDMIVRVDVALLCPTQDQLKIICGVVLLSSSEPELLLLSPLGAGHRFGDPQGALQLS